MLIVAGLGNPGPQYAGNRHNIGFMAVDAIARRHGFSPWARKFKGEIAEGQIGGEKVLLLKPLTFMNVSGESVGEAVRFFKLEPKDVVVVHDELDLPPGKVRIKTGGGHGGHNGLKSIDAHLGRDYRRLRLGIGHPGTKEAVNPHVLGDFAKVDRPWLDDLLEAVAGQFELVVKGEDAQFLNRVTLATTGSEEPSSAKGSAGGAAMRAGAPGGGATKGQSHIRQARSGVPQVKIPEKGPMADMLKKLFGKE
ncbi:aminoacyl-tRNA hydrolase [Mangrovibrevibacter kandeliae]|uniref:aminoacyl-tRNA hydrolase n=1 Tax=Mangrovibrevibacter kandeliae TaxID=2968473 RepID=UPI002117B3F0|nr:aminoacyl-tRNA hydrolase [Aurantimonas sp. CSK15Z-1]MCQ8781018.1 aminoacyl-tRNA hydrolase [Aurantimonas sp. CSK15Z-1]